MGRVARKPLDVVLPKPLDVVLPWPPSVNHYWAARGKGRYIASHARAWHREAWAILQAQGRRYTGPVALYVFAHPPDKRRRDLDNLLKGIQDALVSARVLLDDYQVAEVHVIRRPPERPGRVRVVVEPIDLEQDEDSVWCDTAVAHARRCDTKWPGLYHKRWEG